MKITYIVGNFPKLSETFILNQITGLINKGHEVDVISFQRRKEDNIHEDVYQYNLLDKTQYIKKAASTNIGFVLNEKLVASLLFSDILHAHFASIATDLALTISKAFHIPFVFTTHANDIFSHPDKDQLREKALNAHKVITISEYNKAYFKNLIGHEFSDKIDVIRCGIDLDRFNYIEREPKKTVKILFVGRLIEKKGLPYALAAFNQVIQSVNNIELKIIGDGNKRAEIEDQIKGFSLQKKIALLGSLPQSRIIKAMEDADIFLLPSITAQNGDREGAPVSLMEAHATGLPVISTLHTGIPEVVVNGTSGFLVPEKDTHALSVKLKALIENYELRKKMGKAGRLHIEKWYDHKTEIDKLENLFKGVIKERPLISELPEAQKKVIKQRIKNIINQFEQREMQIEELLHAAKNTFFYKLYKIIPSKVRNYLRPDVLKNFDE